MFVLRKSKVNFQLIKNIFNQHLARNLSAKSDFILDSALPDIQIPNVTIPELLFEACEKYEKFTAIECGITGHKYTYGELLKKSTNLSNSLRRNLKVKEGDVIAILAPNIPEYALVLLGALRAGLIVTTLNPIYTQEEISRQLKDSSAKALITLNFFWNTASASVQNLQNRIPILIIKTQQNESLPRDAIDFTEFTNNANQPNLISDFGPGSPEEIALLPYSSGTTGLPKGVQLTHRNLVSSVTQNANSGLDASEPTTDSHQDVIPAVLPMFHIFGLSVNTLWALSQGAKIVTLPKFTPDTYISMLKNHKPHVLMTVPPIVLFLTTQPIVKREYLESVRVLFCGAAPLGALDEEKFLEKAGNKNINCLQGYGLTETSPSVTATSVHLKHQVKNTGGSIGRPLVNTLVKLVKTTEDGDFTPLGPNQTGEILVKGPQVMAGYLNRPEETRSTIVEDGWLRTGDVAYYNEDRILFITDRLKELIKVKAFQVPPAELEELIRHFPDVEDAAVIGIPHPSQGEVPRAYVVPKNGARINTADLKEFVAKRVAEYKQLAGGVVLVESIPKNATGKILRRSLKLEYQNEMARKAL